jgi:hypothetical protein
MEQHDDQLMWPHTKDGEYSVKSGYNLLCQWNNAMLPSSAHLNNQDKAWKILWSLNIIPRHKVLLWRIIQGAVPVRSELSKRGVPCNILCPRCLIKEETLDHTFMKCQHAARIWFGSKLGISFDHRHTNFSDWIIHALNNLNTEDLIYMAAIAYGIWFTRNQMIFESTDVEDDYVINHATKSIQEFQRATQIPSSDSHNTNHDTFSNHRSRLRSTTNKQWNRPNEGTIKVNCDANLSREGRWGLGATYRDSDGELLGCRRRNFGGGLRALQSCFLSP